MGPNQTQDLSYLDHRLPSLHNMENKFLSFISDPVSGVVLQPPKQTETHAVEYDSALKKKGSLPFVTTWIGLEDTKWNSQTQKDKYGVTSLTYVE